MIINTFEQYQYIRIDNGDEILFTIYNPGMCIDDPIEHAKSIVYQSYDYKLAMRLNMTLIYCVFPRSTYRYTHRLAKECVDEIAPWCKRLIESFDQQVYGFGFSASGMFIQSLSMIYPKLFKKVVFGGISCLPTRYDIVNATYQLYYPKQDGYDELAKLHYHAYDDMNDISPYLDRDERRVINRQYGMLYERLTRIQQWLDCDNYNYQGKHEITDECMRYIVRWMLN